MTVEELRRRRRQRERASMARIVNPILDEIALWRYLQSSPYTGIMPAFKIWELEMQLAGGVT